MAVGFRALTPNSRKAIRERRSRVSLALYRSSQTSLSFDSKAQPPITYVTSFSLNPSMAVERVWLHGSATIDPNGAGANQSTPTPSHGGVRA